MNEIICHYFNSTLTECENLVEFIKNYKGCNNTVNKFKCSDFNKIITEDIKDETKPRFAENVAKICCFCNSIKNKFLNEQDMLTISRNIVNQLKDSVKHAKDEWLGPGLKRVEKGWGWEDWIWNGERYCGKILFFHKDKKCSFHYHKIKEETFYLRSGKLMVIYGFTDDINAAYKKLLLPGDNFFIPIGLRHQMIGIEESELFEFSSTHYEDDSYRVIKGD